jgi:hypothetical protein
MATTLKYKRLNKKDMKIFFPIVLCLFIVSCKRSPVVVQDRAITKISELPVASSLDTNDLFIVSDAGTVSRSLKGRKIADAISDSAYRIRFEIDTAKINIRAEGLGGSGAWTKIGNHVQLTTNTDTIHMGTSDEYGKLNVYGSIGTVAGNIKADHAAGVGGDFIGRSLILSELGGSGVILSTGDDLYFYDNTSGTVKLSDLSQAGGYFALTNSTITPTLPAYNLNIGSLNETTYKVKVTGTFNATQPIYSDDKIYFQGSNGYTGAPPYIESDADTLYFSDNSGKFSLQELTTSYGDTIAFSNGVYITTVGAGTFKLGYGSASLQLLANYAGYNGWGTNNLGSLQFAGYSSDIAAAFRNDTISDAADSAIFRSWKATKEYVLEHGGGGGVVDTAGGQDVNKIAVWSNKTVLDGPDDFTYQNGNMKITVGETDRVSLYPTVADGAASIAYLFSSNTNLTNATSKVFQFDNQSSNKFYQIGSGRVFNENGGFQAGLGTTNFSDITATGFRTFLNSVCLLNLDPGISALTEGIAYEFNTKNNLTGNSRLLTVKDAGIEKFAVLNDSTIVRNYLLAKDTIYYRGKGLPAGSLWYTNTSTGAIDTAHTEPAYIGWEMEDLPTLEEYEADVKMINGHMERRIWYIDYETKELKSQYGWSGLGMMNTQSAYMIYHEITVRWMFEQNKKIDELQKVQIPSDVTNILLELNRLKFVVFALLGLFILLIAFSIVINRK